MSAYFYQIYPRSFMDGNGDGYGDFIGITQKLDYLKSLGIDCIWIQPIYPSPMFDDGYDISDFVSVDPKFGTIEEFQRLIEAVHQIRPQFFHASKHLWAAACMAQPVFVKVDEVMVQSVCLVGGFVITGKTDGVIP